MAARRDLFVRVSLPWGHFTTTKAAADRGKWRVLKQDALDGNGRPLPPKPRTDVQDAPKPRKKAARELRSGSAAATPTPTKPTSGTSEESE
jgi:hypothetical protein